MPDVFHLIVNISVKDPQDAGAVERALARMRPLCLAEPGCLRWEAYRSLEAPSTFVLVEHWQTREHWEEHGNLPAIQTLYIPEILPRVERQVHPSMLLA